MFYKFGWHYQILEEESCWIQRMILWRLLRWLLSSCVLSWLEMVRIYYYSWVFAGLVFFMFCVATITYCCSFQFSSFLSYGLRIVSWSGVFYCIEFEYVSEFLFVGAIGDLMEFEEGDSQICDSFFIFYGNF